MNWKTGRFADGDRRRVYWVEVGGFQLRVYPNSRCPGMWIWDVEGLVDVGKAPMAHRAESAEDGKRQAEEFWEKFHCATQTGLRLE